MTTDTRPKTTVVTGGGWTVGGMAKGAGMLAPGLATMLCVLTTDAVADAGDARRGAARGDAGSPSTGSTPTAACPPTTPCCCWPAAPPGVAPTTDELTAAVTAACHDLAQQLVADAEGATKKIAIEVVGAADRGRRGRGRPVGRPQQPGQDRAVRQRPQLGPDPRRGRHHRRRVRAGRGSTSPSTASGSAGAARPPRTASKVDLTGRDVTIRIDLHAGDDAATIWTNDLSHGVRARELGVLDMTVLTRDLTDAQAQGGHADRGAAVAGPVPGATVVVKYGGNAMIDPELQRAFAADMVFLRYAGLKPVVVHGGGPQISAMLGRLGIASEFRGGLRVTTPEAMDVVRMVLVGQVGRELVGLINEHGPFAVGLSGEDARLFTAVRRPAYVDGEPVDVGPGRRRRRRSTPSAVDRPDRGRPDPGHLHRRAGRRRRAAQPQRRHRRRRAGHRARRPQAGRAHRRAGPLRRLARHRQPGLRRSPPTSWRRCCPRWTSGMVPKMEACLRAVRGGVPAAHVVDGRVAALHAAGSLHLGGVRNDGGRTTS